MRFTPRRRSSEQPANSPVLQKFSGCHCTPTQNVGRRAFDRFHDAILRHRGHDERRRHAADGLVMPAVDGARLEWLRGPSAAARRVPGVTRTGCAMWSLGTSIECSRSDVTDVGMSCTSEPPAATFSTCTPRQIAKTGMSRATASRESGISNRSRSASTSVVGCGVSPYRAGSTSRPPVSSSPSMRSRRRRGIVRGF